jgi:hypothetical protein
LLDLIFHAEKDSAQVGIDDVLKDRDIQIRERREATVDSSVVVGKIEPTEGCDGFADERLGSGGISNITRDEAGLPTSAAEFLDGLLALVVRARGAVMITRAPRRMKAWAAARPRPRVPPVTRATFPANVLTMRSSFLSRGQDVASAIVRSNHHTSLMLRTSLRPNVQR